MPFLWRRSLREPGLVLLLGVLTVSGAPIAPVAAIDGPRWMAPAVKPVSAATTATGSVDPISPPGEVWLDPEVLRLGDGEGLIAWQEGRTRTVWVARLDAETGLPSVTERWRMGDDATPLAATFNGPEFGLDGTGWALYYTRGSSSSQVARSTLLAGVPQLEVITEGDQHFSPMAGKDPASSSTRLLLLRRPPEWGTAAWIDMAEPDREHDIVYLRNRTDGDLRWIDGTASFVTNAHPAHPGKLSVVDTAAGTVTRVSDEPGRVTDPYGWLAPDGRGARVLAVVDDTELAVWSDEGGVWRRSGSWVAPSGAPGSIGSPEPFVAGGRSYASLTLATAPEARPGVTDQQVWVIGLGQGRPFAARCDDGRPAPVTRVDPEVFVTAERVFVYYYDLAPGSSEAYRCVLDLPEDDPQTPSIRSIPASATGPGITDLIGQHAVVVGAPDARLGRLLVFYPGTGATADRYSLFLTRAAALGYHAIGLAYDNRDAINWDICPSQPDRCYEDARLEILLGIESGYDPPSVDADNAAFHRLVRLLAYLHARHPDEGWDAYLAGDEPRWNRIVFAGHSQGGGHAAMTAKLHEVARAILFDATEPKAWTAAPFATTADRLYGFAHEMEPIFAPITRSWANLRLPGDLTNVDAAPPPFGGSHRLGTATEACRGDPTSAGFHHNCPVVDDYTPLDPDGNPSLQYVWDFLLDAVPPPPDATPTVTAPTPGSATNTPAPPTPSPPTPTTTAPPARRTLFLPLVMAGFRLQGPPVGTTGPPVGHALAGDW